MHFFLCFGNEIEVGFSCKEFIGLDKTEILTVLSFVLVIFFDSLKHF